MVTWICNICGERFTQGRQLVLFKLQDHVNLEHSKELTKALADRTAYENELEIFAEQLQEKYPNYNKSFTSLFTEQPIKPRKLWKCPKCKEEMTYHYKFYHESNPKECRCNIT